MAFPGSVVFWLPACFSWASSCCIARSMPVSRANGLRLGTAPTMRIGSPFCAYRVRHRMPWREMVCWLSSRIQQPKELPADEVSFSFRGLLLFCNSLIISGGAALVKYLYGFRYIDFHMAVFTIRRDLCYSGGRKGVTEHESQPLKLLCCTGRM